MKPTLLLLVLSITIAAQTGQRGQYFGDRSKGEFYPVACGIASSITSDNWVVFDSREDAERRGFQFTPCPLDSAAAKIKHAKASKVVTLTRVPVPRIAILTSEPSKWVGKLVLVDADAKISNNWRYGHDTYAFIVSDGSASCYLYMEKTAARYLRDMIRKQPSDNGVHGQFAFYLDPDGYSQSGNVYAQLISFELKSK